MDTNDLAMMFIKYFGITLSSIIIFFKALNLKRPSIGKCVIICFATAALSGLMFALDSFQLFRIIIIIVPCGLLMYLMTPTDIGLAMTAMMTFVGISYLFFMIIALILSIVVEVFMPYLPCNGIRQYIFACILQLAVSLLTFKIKRLRGGFSFLKRPGAGLVGVIISGIIISLHSFLNKMGENKLSEGFLILFAWVILLCGAGFLYWAHSSQQRYLNDEGQKQAQEKLKEEYGQQKETNIKLMEENTVLGWRIHKEAERVSSIEKKVQFLQDNTALAEEITPLLDQAQEIKSNYAKDMDSSGALPKTKVVNVDNMFYHMEDEAHKSGISFELAVSGNVMNMIEEVVSQGRLTTLIGDHVRDAINAVEAGGNGMKHIAANIGLLSGYYGLSVKDTGIEFEIDILLELGKHQITTREGGSGIGFMTTFETMRETGASLIITEFDPESSDFSKNVAIRFDGRGEYIVESYKADAIQKKCQRPDIIIRPINEGMEIKHK